MPILAAVLQSVTANGAADQILEHAVGIMLALAIGQTVAGIVALIGLNAKVNQFMQVQFPALQKSLDDTNFNLRTLRDEFAELKEKVVRHDERIETLLRERKPH